MKNVKHPALFHEISHFAVSASFEMTLCFFSGRKEAAAFEFSLNCVTSINQTPQLPSLKPINSSVIPMRSEESQGTSRDSVQSFPWLGTDPSYSCGFFKLPITEKGIDGSLGSIHSILNEIQLYSDSAFN